MPDLSVFALGVALVSAVFTGIAAIGTARQAKYVRDQTRIQADQVASAQEQTRLQREQARALAQPYVWADIQPDPQVVHRLQLVVSNSGPTVATNVRVTFDPPLPSGPSHADRVLVLQEVLEAGLSSIAPHRSFRWTLGVSHEVFGDGPLPPLLIRVEADGPFGPLPPLEIPVNFNDWATAQDAPDGSLHLVRQAIKELTKAVQKSSD